MFKINLNLPDTLLFDPAGSEKFIDHAGSIFIDDALVELQNNIVELAPVGVSGNLRASIKTDRQNVGTMIKGRVYSDVKYTIVQEEGRKKAWVSKEGQKGLERWVRLSSGGKAFFSDLKADYPKITVKQAVFLISRSMSKKKRKGKKFFEKGAEESIPEINSLYKKFGITLEKGLSK